jgi:hypothetical protein
MRFTSQNARENAAKSQAARRANYLATKEAIKGQSVQRPPECAIAAERPVLDDFSRARLSRVRRQLDRLDNMMEGETDPQKLDRLASAQAKLAEQERQLAGRPLPGSLRPTGRTVNAGMIESSSPGPGSAAAPSSPATPRPEEQE